MEETPFDELTRGEQFLRLLHMEYEDLIRVADFRNRGLRYALEFYALEPKDREAYEKEIEVNTSDIQYFRRLLGKLGGVENEDTILTESNSESPTDRYKGETCTTVT